MLKLEFTQEEAVALIQLIDVAVHNSGLKVAGTALHLVAKIEEAGKAAQTQTAEVKSDG